MSEDIILQDTPVAKYFEDVKKKPQSKPSKRLNLAAELSLSDERIPDLLDKSPPKPMKTTPDSAISALEVKVTELDSGTIQQQASNRLKLVENATKPRLNDDKIEGILSNPLISPLWRLVIGSSLTLKYQRCMELIPSLREKYWRIVVETPDFILPSSSVAARTAGNVTPEANPEFGFDWSVLQPLYLGLSIFLAYVILDSGSIMVLILSIMLLIASGLRYLFASFLANFASRHRENERKLQKLAMETSKFNKLFRKAIQYIQEIELVSLGFKVSNPLSPIARLERSSKARKSGSVRQAISNALKALNKVYNGGEISSVDDPLSLSALKQLQATAAVKRFDFLSSTLDSLTGIIGIYNLNTSLLHLSLRTEAASDEIQRAMDIQEWTVSNAEMKGAARKQTETTGQVAEHLTALQRQFSTLNAKISLMKQTLASFSEDEENKAQRMGELLETFAQVKSEIDECGGLREGLERSFDRLLSETNARSSETTSEPTAALPIPIPEDEKAETADEGLDPEALKNLINDAVEKVYEAFKDDNVPTGAQTEASSAKPKLTREQRIAQQKKKREQAERSMDSLMERLTMVRELRDVLSSRGRLKPTPNIDEEPVHDIQTSVE